MVYHALGATRSVAPATATTLFAASTAKRTSKAQSRPCAVQRNGATKAPSSAAGGATSTPCSDRVRTVAPASASTSTRRFGGARAAGSGP